MSTRSGTQQDQGQDQLTQHMNSQMNFETPEPTSPLLLLGLLDPAPVSPPRGEPHAVETVHSLKVELWSSVARLQCSCGRTTAVLVAREDWEAAEPPYGRFHCHVCQRELQDCTTNAQKLRSWLKRTKFTKDEHVVLPKPVVNIRECDSGKTVRIKRFVYESFHELDLTPAQQVLSTCNHENCINPFHLYVAGSSARKVTPAIKEYVEECLRSHMRTKQIQVQVQERFHTSLSPRTLSSIKKEWRQSNAT